MTPAPDPSDASGLFYCAHDGNGTLYVAGLLTDSSYHNPVGLLINGDAAEVNLDMLADGFRMPLVDDHAISVDNLGRMANFAIYPVDATAGTCAEACPRDTWRFELAIPADQHRLASLDTGSEIGATWVYYDNIGGPTWGYRLSSFKQRLVMQ